MKYVKTFESVTAVKGNFIIEVKTLVDGKLSKTEYVGDVSLGESWDSNLIASKLEAHIFPSDEEARWVSDALQSKYDSIKYKRYPGTRVFAVVSADDIRGHIAGKKFGL